MKIYLRNTDAGLIPLYPSDWEEKKKLKIGQEYSADIKEVKDRNYLFLKKFMALCRVGNENSKNVEMPFDAYRKYATIKAGYFDVYHTPKGVMIEAKSIAFDKMKTDAEFQKVYNDVLSFIIKDTGATKEDIEKNLLSFM